jgi:hypothetical protein
MYVLTQRFWGSWAAGLSVAYMYAPYLRSTSTCVAPWRALGARRPAGALVVGLR